MQYIYEYEAKGLRAQADETNIIWPLRATAKAVATTVTTKQLMHNTNHEVFACFHIA